jgi:antitoxin (DNA-binding transcriptional repressor) of toxin-antitoxin stability system
METQIIGIKQLHKDLSKISEQAKKGQSFIVVKNSKPVFRIEPMESLGKPRYTLKDFEKIRFKGEKNLSKNIDKILYGA